MSKGFYWFKWHDEPDWTIVMMDTEPEFPHKEGQPTVYGFGDEAAWPLDMVREHGTFGPRVEPA